MKNLSKQDIIALVGNDCAQCLIENLYEKETEEYNALVGVRLGQYDEEKGNLIFTIVNPETGHFWSIMIETDKWWEEMRTVGFWDNASKVESEYWCDLQHKLRELVFSRIQEETEYEV